MTADVPGSSTDAREVAGFWLGVLPYVLLTKPSDVSGSDAVGFAVIVFAPGLVFIAAGAAAGAGLRHLLERR